MLAHVDVVLDVQRERLVRCRRRKPDRKLVAEVLVVGGGLGGAAAALAACDAGRNVVLSEETDWIGGQLTSQGVSAPDEHRCIEHFGGTRRYATLRERIREHYRTHYRLSQAAAAASALNPGGGWVSQLCCEPRSALAALQSMLAPHTASGRLRVLLRHRAVGAAAEADRVRSVRLRHLDGQDEVEVEAAVFLDATELGDLLPLTETEYVCGAESGAETGEPSARTDGAAPACIQSFTYPFAVELHDGGAYCVPKPAGYRLNRERQPYTFGHVYYDGRGTLTYRMFGPGEGNVPPFWTYRRLIAAENFADPAFPHDIAMINWPGNDFRHGSLIDVPADAALAGLRVAKDLSLGFCRWLQCEAPRDDGGEGYPELELRPDVMGTADGLSRYPYIRESRRIRARRTIREQEISAAGWSEARAAPMPDSVGLGWYMIDIHPGELEEKIIPQPTRPFQIPLGALLPVRVTNLLPAAKNIGTTHITNGAYRLHPVEWNIGESAGSLAAFALERGVDPAVVWEDPELLRAFQRRIVGDGVPIFWHVDVGEADDRFIELQLRSAWGEIEVDAQSLVWGSGPVPGPAPRAGSG